MEYPSGSGPALSSATNTTTKKTKMDKLKKLNPVSLKKSPKPEKRPNIDAMEDTTNDIPLHYAIEDARKALDLFLNNEFASSKQIMEPL